jgi:hypothetical protein
MHRSSIRRRAAALGVAAVGLAGLTACDPLPLLTLTVTATTEDLVDADPGDGVCEATAGAGDCTLRAAVMEANATPPGTDVRMVLAPGSVHTLTRHVNCSEENWGGIDETVEDLDVTRDLTVIGNGATITTAGGDYTDPTFGTLPCLIRVFDHHSGRLRVEDADLVGETYGSGGALRNWATTELVDVVAVGRGSVGGVVLHNGGTLTLIRSTVTGGEAFGSITIPIPQGPWAGVWSQTGSLVLLDSHVRSNNDITRYASSDFAGVHVASGSATIIQSIVTGHRTTVVGPGGAVTLHGDGIDARGPVTLIRSTVADNGAGRDVVGTAAVSASGSILGVLRHPRHLAGLQRRRRRVLPRGRPGHRPRGQPGHVRRPPRRPPVVAGRRVSRARRDPTWHARPLRRWLAHRSARRPPPLGSGLRHRRPGAPAHRPLAPALPKHHPTRARAPQQPETA